MLLFFILSLLLIGIDQLTKYLAASNLDHSVPIIKNVLHLQYAENTGSAFSMFDNISWFRWVFIVLAVLVCGFIIYLNISRKYYSKLFYISSILIVSGAIGNVIDRLVHGYVVDFIYLKFINFPIFNFADICLTFGVIILFIDLIFFDSKRKKNNSEGNTADVDNNSLGTDDRKEN